MRYTYYPARDVYEFPAATMAEMLRRVRDAGRESALREKKQ